ncbi:DivIVA domain-containing protein [Neomicrococcus aestuarii]|uniref:Cell wall synthesis protein Wag31 n=1 Tax=Neomicrococcus aestuarii TaxID=556325 RepID=A0A7W8TXH2_9MICC|nr:DivIVA domain-containing protein [Neomicrococcus aestuarii]MBB5513763.1 DivIVA domain-containing protein [Neomicrococcus aestuarii]
MALTPEDVVNKRFQPTKFREGYDQIEVDDFLDEIVTELRRLNKENNELRQRVTELQAGKEAAAPAAATADDTKVPAPVPAVKDAAAADDKGADKTVAAANFASTQSAATATAAPGGEQHRVTAESATGVLAMAQRLHDEYVSAGIEQRDKLIAEAKSKAETLVSDANAKSQKLVTDADTRSKKMVSDAEETTRKTLTDLDQKKTVLESKIDQLRGFERDYRGRLKTYIEGQLRDLESKGSVETASAENTQR